MPAAGVTVSAIVPGLNVAGMIERCLAAIAASDYPVAQILFFDDGSTDRSGAIASAHGAKVLRNPGPPLGPAEGRNRAASCATGEILWFVDADVLVHSDALRLLAAAMEEPGVAAAFGSYDDRPPAPNTASRYVNLRHHFVHGRSSPVASTFWAGMGAVRREVFFTAGGFSRSYDKPSIEDIELGMRIVAGGGRIRLEPRAQGTHLKHWTVRQLWRTDIRQRAIPWSRLIAERGGLSLDLNASADERISAILAHLVVLLLAAAVLFPPLLAAAGLSLWLYGYRNRAFFSLLRSRLSVSQTGGAILLHVFYHIYASQVLGWTLLFSRRRAGSPRGS